MQDSSGTVRIPVYGSVLAQLFPFISCVSWCGFLNCAGNQCGKQAYVASPHCTIQSQKSEGEGGWQNRKLVCAAESWRTGFWWRHGLCVFLTKLPKISASKPAFLKRTLMQKAGDYSRSTGGTGVWVSRQGHSLCRWRQPFTWEVAVRHQARRVSDIVPVLPQGLVIKICPK